MGAGERPGIEPAQMGAAAHLAADHPGIFQHLDVLGGGRERDREGCGELAHRPLAAGKLAQHLPPRGVAQRVENGIHLGVLVIQPYG